MTMQRRSTARIIEAVIIYFGGTVAILTTAYLLASETLSADTKINLLGAILGASITVLGAVFVTKYLDRERQWQQLGALIAVLKDVTAAMGQAEEAIQHANSGKIHILQSRLSLLKEELEVLLAVLDNGALTMVPMNALQRRELFKLRNWLDPDQLGRAATMIFVSKDQAVRNLSFVTKYLLDAKVRIKAAADSLS